MKFADLYEKNSNELYEITKSNIDFLNACNDFFEGRNEDFIPFITIQSNRYHVEVRNNNSFLWMPSRFKIKIDIACKVRFYFTRGGNIHCTNHLNFCRQTDNKSEERIFDNQGLLLIELDIIAPGEINFSGDYFNPSQIYEHSDDNRELSCILNKIEASHNGREFEEYPLQGL
jgi:hypothetical protein